MSNIVTLTTENFDQEVLESSVPVLVDFWAPWCGPCKMLAPTIDKLADAYAGRVKVAKLDADQAPEIMPRYGFRGLPTVAFFKDGEVTTSLTAAHSMDRYASILDGLLGVLSEKDITANNREIDFYNAITGKSNLVELSSILEEMPHLANKPFKSANGNSRTPMDALLLYTTGKDIEEAIAVLLEGGAIPTPAELAGLGRADELRKALANDPSVATWVDDNGFSALFRAAKWGRVDCMKALLGAGADPNLKNNNGVSIFTFAILGGCVESMTTLIEAGGNLSSVINPQGGTLLHMAASFSNASMVQCLLDQGIDPNLKNNKGERAIDVARQSGDLAIISCLDKINT